MGSLGTTEIILLVATLFLLFGASALPKLARSIGESRRAFKEGLKEFPEKKEVTSSGFVSKEEA